ncbi:unnamed protein product [Meganyctiphanes norvegica]|uniref:Uncharacterized protein n=1 Tax=Meganyctiphanes norvegica TaxID=48144 RepID=A0AAV2QV51_MEGNR
MAAQRMAVMVALVGAVMPQPQFIPANQQFIRPFIPILGEDRDGPNLDGSYRFSYDSADGSTRSEVSQPTSPFTKEVRGSYSYTSPNGQLVTVNYVADENGYRAESPTGSIPQTPIHSLQQLQAAGPVFARNRQENRVNAEIRFNQQQLEQSQRTDFANDQQLRFNLLQRQRAAARLRQIGLSPALRPTSAIRPIPHPLLVRPQQTFGAFSG